MRTPLLALVALVALSVVPAGAQPNNGDPSSSPSPAPPLPVDGTWTFFCWTMGVGSLNTEGPFTFMGPATLDVTDAFIDGDAFDVLDGGMSIGTTSVPTDTGSSLSDPDAAFADPDWSSGSFALGAGAHSITLQVTTAATGFSDGCGFLRAIPSAPTMPVGGLVALMAVLLGGGYLLLRRRLSRPLA